jgi:Transport and Golgi organisation 2
MCTLSYYPKSNNTGFILTFNRDEMPTRSSIDIVNDEQRSLIYPKDTLHGGTWLAMSVQNGRFTCLLNGAFERHERRLPYRKSRGLVLLESFDYADIRDFWQNYDLTNIEPFTMISGQANQLWEFRWDGTFRHSRLIDVKKPEIWSSATLYNHATRSQREKNFLMFLALKKAKSQASDLWQFHQTPDADKPENGILMRRPLGQPSTVSISQITYSFSPQTIDFQYYELGEHKISKHQFSYGKQLMAV